jgi:hypothetical protein
MVYQLQRQFSAKLHKAWCRLYVHNKAKVIGNESATAYINRVTDYIPGATGENHYKHPSRLTKLLTQLTAKVKLVTV